MTDNRLEIEIESQSEHAILLRPCPPRDAPHTDHINWLMECGCKLGQVVTALGRQIGTSDNQLTLIFSYMAGRAFGAYVDLADTQGKESCMHMFHLGSQHGLRAASEHDMDSKATSEGTETKQ